MLPELPVVEEPLLLDVPVEPELEPVPVEPELEPVLVVVEPLEPLLLPLDEPPQPMRASVATAPSTSAQRRVAFAIVGSSRVTFRPKGRMFARCGGRAHLLRAGGGRGKPRAMTPSQEIALGIAAASAVAALVLASMRRRARRIAEAVAYLRGVHHVLSDAPDAAIGELTRAAELKALAGESSMETYFALGKLFRRKGDLEQAIRLHRNIILRPGLAAEVKREAQLELALDLQKAGLLGQAAEAYEKFLAEAPEHPEALAGLRTVHEAARDWQEAAEVQVRAVKAGHGGADVLAHLLASAARDALGRDPEHAQKLADGGVQAHPQSPDAQLARAEVLAARGEKQAAAEQLTRTLASFPEVALSVEPLLAQVAEPRLALEALGSDQGGPPARLVALARARWRGGDRAGAAEALRRALCVEPGFAPARRDLGQLLLGAPLDPALQPAYEELLRALGQPELELQCKACRHTTGEPGWQCPRCGAWDSLQRAG